MISDNRYEYIYEGPVLHFDSYVMSNWTASTYAATAAKARSNLTYRFKNAFGYASNAKITLPGTLTRVGRKER